MNFSHLALKFRSIFKLEIHALPQNQLFSTPVTDYFSMSLCIST